MNESGLFCCSKSKLVVANSEKSQYLSLLFSLELSRKKATNDELFLASYRRLTFVPRMECKEICSLVDVDVVEL